VFLGGTMSKKLTVVAALVILIGAMGLKTAVADSGSGSVIMANGGAPTPPAPWKNGGAPTPPAPWKNGGAPTPPAPWKNGGAPTPPAPWK
jgi:hypothetical protein